MDKITVFDNFLSNHEAITCKNILKDLKWNYGHMSDERKNNISTPFWVIDVYNEEFFNTHIMNIIEKKTKRKFDINAIHINGQTFGQSGIYHEDDYRDDCYTFVLYFSNVKKELQEIADGYLEIKVPGEKFIASYEPLFNRGIIFPSNYLHRGCSYSRYIPDIRVSIAWKLKEIT